MAYQRRPPEPADAALFRRWRGLHERLDPAAFDFDVAELKFNVDAPGGIS